MICILRAEYYKLRHDKMSIIGIILMLLLPILFILKGLVIDKGGIEINDWIISTIGIISLVFPIISGFFITHFMQSEYQNDTIKNILTVPVSRITFINGKLIIWFIWYITGAILTSIITIAGIFILYPDSFKTCCGEIFIMQLLDFLLSFLAFTPIFIITIIQRTNFYPSMLICIVLDILLISGSQVNDKFITLASCVPWTAVTVFRLLPKNSGYSLFCLTSIILCSLLSIFLSNLVFKRQGN